eukprot:TRINITY_DN894_c0_g1_i1.p1 TRINITY_DN894_c0_g1~~TRINITY_DN894_c0_g1_i1.p1  ORF type:complete len:342 (-),score=62.33 TRINITY_DN894_c0_g1_i1:67-1092(-)
MSKLPVLIDHLQQAAIIVNADGIIEKINPPFSTLCGWQPSEIEKQNVSLLICPKLIKKGTHDSLLKSYTPSKASRLIGKPRILAVKNSDDEEMYLRIHIIPLAQKKEHSFLALFSSPTDVMISKHWMSSDDLVVALEKYIKDLPPDKDFSTNCQDTILIVNEFLEPEIFVIANFIKDNFYLSECWKLAQSVIFSSPLGNLVCLKNLLNKHFTNGRLAYYHLIWMHSIKPLLLHSTPSSPTPSPVPSPSSSVSTFVSSSYTPPPSPLQSFSLSGHQLGSSPAISIGSMGDNMFLHHVATFESTISVEMTSHGSGSVSNQPPAHKNPSDSESGSAVFLFSMSN